MSQLGTFTEYFDYWNNIAISHVDINALKFGEKEIVKCGARSNLDIPVLWVESYEPVRVIDRLSDNQNGQLNSTLLMMDKKPAAWAAQRTKYEEMEQIVKDIIGKILYDYNAGDLQVELNGYKFGWSETVLGSTEVLGCRLDFSFLRPERLVYNAAKWI